VIACCSAAIEVAGDVGERQGWSSERESERVLTSGTKKYTTKMYVKLQHAKINHVFHAIRSIMMGSKNRMTKLNNHCTAAWRPPPIVRKLSEWISVHMSHTPAIWGVSSTVP
jgi:hypothetical protein